MVDMKRKPVEPSGRMPYARPVASRAPASAAGTPGGSGSPPAWMAVGLRGLARMSPEERLIAVENIEALVLTAYGDGPTAAMRGPDARGRSRDVLIRLGWAEPGIFLRAPAADVLARLRAEIIRSGLL